jgi:hypothetical protein
VTLVVVIVARPYRRLPTGHIGNRCLSRREVGGGAGGLAAGTDVELGQDGGDVVVDGAHGDHQLVGDLGVGAAVGEEAEDFELAVGEAGRVGAGAGAGAAGEVGDPQLAQVAADQVGRGRGAEAVERRERLQQLLPPARGGQLQGVLVGGAERPPQRGRARPVALDAEANSGGQPAGAPTGCPQRAR